MSLLAFPAVLRAAETFSDSTARSSSNNRRPEPYREPFWTRSRTNQ